MSPSPEYRLRGRSVFLSASVPAPHRAEKYHRVPEAHLEIPEAITSVARAVFAAGGTLVFGGHPAISPLIAMVAGEYLSPPMVKREEATPAPIRIYQSRAFEDCLPDETLMMFRIGYADLVWTDAVGDERYDPEVEYTVPPCPRSLALMRQAMINKTRPIGMVCIGGMEGVEDEADLFAKQCPRAPIFVFAKTGGAAARLANHQDSPDLRVLDHEVLARLETLRSKLNDLENRSSSTNETAKTMVPYPLIAQIMVQELADLNLSTRR